MNILLLTGNEPINQQFSIKEDFANNFHVIIQILLCWEHIKINLLETDDLWVPNNHCKVYSMIKRQ